MIDADGYPTEEALKKITEWDDYSDEGYVKWIDLIKSVWMWPEFFTVGESDNVMVRELNDILKRGPNVLKFSTGGWSGNESVVAAMRGNILWSFNFQSHRTGGHYELRWKP